ncbi:MAG TPA: zinc-dependent metalloprotease [Cyclobacteriaceae bacterium]
MRRRLIILTLAVTCCLLQVDSLLAQKKSKDKKTDKPATAAADTTKTKKVTIKEKVKSCRKVTGLFTLYQDTVTGSVQLFLKKKQLGKEFIYQSFSMGGPPELFLNQNMIRETWIFSIKKTFDRIEFIKSNTNFYYDPANAISKAANVDVSEAMFYSEKLIAEDSSGYLIAADGLFISEKLDQIKPNVPPTLPPGTILNLGSLNPSKSTYLKIRSYPNNTDVVVSLAYENPTPLKFGGKDITDARYVQVKMQHSFIEVPQNDYKPRYDDPRVGYFMQEVDNLTATEVASYKDVINRWHLKKKDPSAALSEPVEPITWWVENTTPVEIRQTIVDAGLKWNEAFEKAGFKNAVVMKIMPDTATWDPADIRYNVIRWVSSDLGYAIGPSFVNPRTGQILGADITIDYGLLFGTALEEDLYQAFGGQHLEAINNHNAMCTIAKGLQLQQGSGFAVLEANNAPAEDIQRLRDQFLSFLILHEMGHTMGLNHNMKSSQMLSPQELINKEITRKLGVSGSVMDYPTINLASDKTKQGDFYTTKTGPYDWWAIEFGYTPLESSKEKVELAKILARSTDPKLTFGNDADITFQGRGIDPRVMVWDMSNDMVSYAEERFLLVNKTMLLLKDRFTREGKSYEGLRQKYNMLRGQRFGMAEGLSHYIGGIYVDRSFPEQKSVNKPFTPVSADYQKKAMKALSKYVFAPNAFDSDTQLFPYLQLQRRGFNFFSGTEDPKLEQNVLNLQADVLNFILNPVTMKRVNNTSLYGNTYSNALILQDLVSAIFDADMSGNVNIYRQNIQTELVQKLASVVNDTQDQYDNASSAAAYSSLINLNARLKMAIAGDAQTKAHRKNLSFLIDRALSKDR